MKRQIRKSVFETNSSSVHSLTMCTQDTYDAWIRGEVLLDKWGGTFVKLDDIDKYKEEHNLRKLITSKEYDEIFEDKWCSYEYFEESLTLPSGEKVISFGFYGENG